MVTPSDSKPRSLFPHWRKLLSVTTSKIIPLWSQKCGMRMGGRFVSSSAASFLLPGRPSAGAANVRGAFTKCESCDAVWTWNRNMLHTSGSCYICFVLIRTYLVLVSLCILCGHRQQTAVPTFSGVNSRFSSKIMFYATFAAHMARESVVTHTQSL